MQDQQQNHSVQITEAWIKGSCALYDLQTQTIRQLLQLQAQQAAAFGAPDFSRFIDGVDGPMRQVLNSGSEHFTQAARQMGEIAQAQAQIGRKFLDQASQQISKGFEQAQVTGKQSFDQMRQMAQQTQSQLDRIQQEAQLGSQTTQHIVQPGRTQEQGKQAR